MQRLVGFGDLQTSNIVARIADEEVAHVAVGVHWFVDVCRKMDRAPGVAFKGLVDFLFPCLYSTLFSQLLRHEKTLNYHPLRRRLVKRV